jgi:hypothetical protein
MSGSTCVCHSRKLSLVTFSERFVLRPPEAGVAEEEDDA